MKETLTSYEQEWSKAKSKKRKRVLIAEDVIAQIRAENIDVKAGIYFENASLNRFAGESLKETLPKVERKCMVCAIGASFISVIRATNDFKIPSGLQSVSSIYSTQMRPRLEDYFSKKQLDLIENTFEKNYVRTTFFPKEETRRAIRFGEAYESDKELLIAIMENIIENKGTFKV